MPFSDGIGGCVVIMGLEAAVVIQNTELRFIILSQLAGVGKMNMRI
jgi:hypothetical protein